MDFHDVLKIAGGILALVLFIPMLLVIWKDRGVGQSSTTWILWGALDVVVTASLIKQHGNYLVPLGFTIGDLVVVGVLLMLRRFFWARLDTLILALVLGSVAAWYVSGPKVATIAATLGVAIAGIPGLMVLWKNPQRNVGNIWAGYVLANVLAFFGGTAMTIEERFAPGVFTLCSLAMVVASRKKEIFD